MQNLDTVFNRASVGEQQGHDAPAVPHSLPSSPISMSRKRSEVEKAVLQRLEAAKEFTSQLPQQELPTVNAYIPPMLENAIFCGHLVTDMDSIAGSIGAAELFGGFAARASEVNSETRFCLDYWNVQAPEPIEKMLTVHPDAGVCLVDHQQTSQLNSCIPVERIVGVIDHHALQNSTIVTDMPIYIDIRPWGSMSTIIAHNFMMYRRRPTRPVAGMLLCAILSDTLNLQGPTTTEWDRLMATVLTDIAGVKDVQLLASQQFKAKSAELETLTANALVTGDQKIFTFKTDCFDGSMAFAVVETTDDEVILKRSAEIVTAMAEDKRAKGISMIYVAVVNIVQLRTRLLLLSSDEIALAKAAFRDGKIDPTLGNIMDLGGLVSRKKDFIPAVTRAIKDGFRTRCKSTMRRSVSDVHLSVIDEFEPGEAVSSGEVA